MKTVWKKYHQLYKMNILYNWGDRLIELQKNYLILTTILIILWIHRNYIFLSSDILERNNFMNHNHQIDSEHSDSINESRVYKISHTRRWIEFSIVIIVVAVLAIIVIPTITLLILIVKISLELLKLHMLMHSTNLLQFLPQLSHLPVTIWMIL